MWAQAVYAGTLSWGYEGINKISQSPGWGNTRLGPLFDTLVSDEGYMDKLRDLEAAYYTSSEADDEWREYCVSRTVKENLYDEGTEDFKEDVQRRFDDSSERNGWAYDMVDWDWLADIVKTLTDEVDEIAYFLKEHPVDKVQAPRRDNDIIDIDKVAGYCTDCAMPITAEDLAPHPAIVSEEILAHAYDAECGFCDAGHFNCYFDAGAKPRVFYRCPYCSSDCAPVEPLNGEHLYADRNNSRPFYWPPGADWPPRRTFTGSPDEDPPWEE